MNINILFDDRQVQAHLRQLIASVANLDTPMMHIAAALQDSVEESFQSQSSPAGESWPDIAEVTKQRR